MSNVASLADSHGAGLRRLSIPAAIACALASSTLVIYLVLLTRQGTPLTNDRVVFVSAAIALLAIATGAAALMRQPRRRTLLLGVSAPGLLGVGFIGAWSIGLSLLIGGVLASIAAVPAARASGWRVSRLLAGAIALTGMTWGALLGTHPDRPGEDVMAYAIGSMIWIAAAILLFPYAYTPREDGRARLVRRVLLIGLAAVIVLGVVTEFLAADQMLG